MNNFARRAAGKSRESGMSLLELMIAGVVLIVGFLGVMVLVTGAIAGNNRNRMDSSATMLTQMVVEQLATLPRPDGTTTVTITDCAGNNWTLSAAAGGAPLSGTSINFSSAQVTNYSMNYVVCGANNTQATYDVRWNVQSLSPGFTSLVTVAARPRGATGDLRRFAIPVSVRVITGRS